MVKVKSKSMSGKVQLAASQRLIQTDEHHHNANEDHWSRHALGGVTEQRGGGAFGSRAVGGHKPKDKTVYDAIESIDYQIPDTVEESLMARIMTRPDDSCFKCCNRAALRRTLMWCLYIFIGGSVSLLITGVLALTGAILDLRVAAVKDLLKSGDIGAAW